MKGLRIFPVLLILTPLIFCSCLEKGDIAVQQGAAYFQRREFTSAENAFKMALTVECSYPPEDIYIMIANCRSQQEDWDGALEWRGKVLETRRDAENLLNMGLIYRLKKDDKTAEDFFKQALDADSGSSDAYASLGALYLSQGRIEDAAAMLEKSLDINDRPAIVHADLAICYGRLKDFTRAEEEISIAAERKLPDIEKFRRELTDLENDAQN
jgi:tetratricopeptide (TPR) repeat protein